jgi:hypothetical protein
MRQLGRGQLNPQTRGVDSRTFSLVTGFEPPRDTRPNPWDYYSYTRGATRPREPGVAGFESHVKETG